MPDYSQIIRGMKYKKYHDPIKIHSFFDAKKMVDLVENPECHFITGCIRSGTNWFATLFYPFTDIVFSDFEDFVPSKIEKWHLQNSLRLHLRLMKT